MPIHAIIFDMDGTLGDTLPSILIALRETFAHFTGRIYTDDEILAMFGPSEEGIIRRHVHSDLYDPALQYYLNRYADLHAEQPFPGIRESRVFGRAHHRLGQVPVAEIVLATPEILHDRAALQAHCARQLSPLKIPVHFSVVEAIPRSAGGKIPAAQQRRHRDQH